MVSLIEEYNSFMSTKIFNGYKLLHKNPFQLHKDFREIFKPLWNQEVASQYVTTAITYLDRYYTGDKYVVEEAGEGKTVKEVLQVYRKKLHSRSSDNSEEPSVADPQLVIGQLPTDGTILALYYGDSSFVEHLEKLGLVEYPYWNNSDRPKNVSEEEWDERRQHWDDAFYGGNEPPLTAGLNFILVSEYEKSSFYAFTKAKELPAVLPNLETRALTIARMQAANEYGESLAQSSDFQMSAFSEYVFKNTARLKKTVLTELKEYNYETDIQPFL